MSFWNKSKNEQALHLNSNEYEQMYKKYVELSGELGICKTNIENIKTSIALLRGQFNAKLKPLKEAEVEEEKKTETINNTEFVGFG